MNETYYPELFLDIETKFNSHFDNPENRNILFSGKFGSGKTTFLRKYFSKSEKKINCIHLFPVNYTVLENQDIFSYIKHDILTELIANDSFPLKEDYYSFLKSPDQFVCENLDRVVATSMLLIPKIGKQLNQFAKEISQLARDFKKFNKPEANNDFKGIMRYLNQFHDLEGGIYENDTITMIVQNWLKQIKLNEFTNVLIIDDMDRIDPNHLFRILNIFSSQFDYGNTVRSNKFGFDKIILVCDIDNIKSIYHSQYGEATDFDGYIDKFYSKEIYRFDSKYGIAEFISKFFAKTYFGIRYENSFKNWDLSNDISIILFLISNLIKAEQLNLRTLKRYENQEYDIFSKTVSVLSQETKVISNPLLHALWFCSMVCGGFRELERRLTNMDSLKGSGNGNISMDYFIANLAMLANSKVSLTSRQGVMVVGTHSYNYKKIFLGYVIKPVPGFRNTYQAGLVSVKDSEFSQGDLSNNASYLENMNWLELLINSVANIQEQS